jgi:Uma2 family endonuclease
MAASVVIEYVEIEGAADLVVEVVSDTSLGKDTQRLPGMYFRAGIRELWLADGRGTASSLVIHRRSPRSFKPAEIGARGFQPSVVFGCRFRLDRRLDAFGNWTYDLRQRREG